MATGNRQVALLVGPVDESVLAFRQAAWVAAWHGADHINLSEILPEFKLTVQELSAPSAEKAMNGRCDCDAKIQRA